MNPFLPTTTSEWLALAAVILFVTLLIADMYRMSKATNVYRNVPMQPDELRTLIAAIVDDRLRANVQAAIIDFAEHHPVTREVYDKIVSRTKDKAIAADQVASLAAANA